MLAAGGSIAAAAIGATGARLAPDIYGRLDKPRWAPPAGAFGPVWSALYRAMGTAAFRLARRDARLALRLHAVQLALDAARPLVFSSGRSRPASLE